MTKIQNISINTPCSEDWNQMTPQQGGRFCDRCAKQVTDFSAKTNEEVIGYLQQENTDNHRICGKFAPNQLQQINAQLAPAPVYVAPKKWIAAVLGGLLLGGGSAQATNKPLAYPTHQTEKDYTHESVSEVSGTSDTTNSIKGFLYEADSVTKIAGANILIKGTTRGVSTDPNGAFLLNNVTPQDTLIVAVPGFPKQEVPLANKDFSQTLKIYLKESPSLGGLCVVKKKRRTVFGRLWHGIKNIFR